MCIRDRLEDLGEADLAQAKGAIEAAVALVKGGHAGSEHVYATIGGFNGAIGTPASGLSVGVYHKPAPVVAAAPTVIPELPRVSPYDTGPKPEEIAREAAATGKPIEQVAKELGAATVTVTSTAKDGSVTTTVKPTGAVPAKVIPPDKANLPSAAERATALSTGKTKTVAVTVTSPKGAKASAPKAPAANAGAPQTNEQTAKPAPRSFAKQVAKDRAGK